MFDTTKGWLAPIEDDKIVMLAFTSTVRQQQRHINALKIQAVRASPYCLEILPGLDSPGSLKYVHQHDVDHH